MPKIAPHRGLLKPLLPEKAKDLLPKPAGDGSVGLSGALSKTAHFIGLPTIRRIRRASPSQPPGATDPALRRAGKLPVRCNDSTPTGSESIDFAANPAYRKMNEGDPANGIVVHLPFPAGHLFGNYHSIESNTRLKEKFDGYLKLLDILRRAKATEVLEEGADEQSCRFYNNAQNVAEGNNDFKSVCREFAKIASGLDKGHSGDEILKSLSKEGFKWFLDMGPGAVHVILSQLSNGKGEPARLIAATTPALQARLDDFLAGIRNRKGPMDSLTEVENDFIFRERESFVADQIRGLARPFLIFGRLHDFKCISAADSPVLYRLRVPGDEETSESAQQNVSNPPDKISFARPSN